MSPSTKKHYVNYLNNMQGYVKIYECRAHEHTIKLTSLNLKSVSAKSRKTSRKILKV